MPKPFTYLQLQDEVLLIRLHSVKTFFLEDFLESLEVRDFFGNF